MVKISACLTILAAFISQVVQEDNQDPNDANRSNSKSTIKVLWSKKLDAPSFGGAAVADADSDGRLEIAFGTYFGDDSVWVLNGEDGTEHWRHDAGSACLDASLRFFDLNSDGKIELLVPISNKGELIAFESDTGKQVWSYQPDPTECTDSPSTIIDLDNDGKFEFVYGTFLGNLHVVDAETGKAKHVYKICDEFIQTAPTVIDLNNDGVLDFVCATFKGKNNVYATDGKTGERLWVHHVEGEHMGMYHGCSVGDLDNDGKTELVIAAYDGKVHCLNAADGSRKWEFKTADRYIMSPTVIVDLDGDGKSEVVSASEYVTVIDCTGTERWSKPCAIANSWDSATRGASIADLSGDGKLDIATLSGQGEFRVLDAEEGKLLYQFASSDFAGFVPQSSSHGLTIADLDGDGKLDVFFVVGTTQTKSKQGLAICLTGFEGVGRGWYMLRHDPQSTGNWSTEIPPSLLRHIENLEPK